MIHWQVARHRVCIAGRTIEAETGRAMPRVLVSIVEMPLAFQRRLEIRARSQTTAAGGAGRIDQALTGDDGLFWFAALPDGEYSLIAELPQYGSRFGKARASATVARDAQGNVKLARAGFVLSPTGLKGKVTAAGRKAGVAMAVVRLKGSGEYSFTDADGSYFLTRVESGIRTVSVSAQGFKTKNQPVTLAEPGLSQVLD